MVPDLSRLATHASFDADELRNEFARRATDLTDEERVVLTAILEIADVTANTAARAEAVIPDLVDLARQVVADPSTGRIRGDGTSIGLRLRRILSAKTLHLLRELRLYRDADGVEPVWPHAGMLILNPVLGCSFGCAYCFRADEQKSNVDWFLSGRPTQVITEDVVVERLSRHPLFVPGVTQLGLHTASTEPFLPQVRESTFRLLEMLEERNWRNDVMIITKHFISKADVARLASFQSFQILLFLTYNAAPAEMETMGARPGFRRRREETVDYLAEYPQIATAHYYRPIVPGWNDDDKQISDALSFGDRLGLTVIGGLKEIPDLPAISRQRGLSLPIVAPGAVGEKHFPPELVARILSIHRDLGLTSTIVGDQSCGLTVMLSRRRGSAVPNVEAIKMYDAVSGRPPKCMALCPPEQLARCAHPPAPDPVTVRGLLDRIGFTGDFVIDDRGLHLRSTAALAKTEMNSLSAHLRYAVFWEPAI